MAMEDLPRNYDAIILGTGMPESILAAALARIGMKVLHLDRNDYYSGGWATLNWMGLNQWIERNQEVQAAPRLTTESIGSISEVYRYDDATDATLVEEGEKLVKLPLHANHYVNVKAEFNCPEKSSPPPVSPPPSAPPRPIRGRVSSDIIGTTNSGDVTPSTTSSSSSHVTDTTIGHKSIPVLKSTLTATEGMTRNDNDIKENSLEDIEMVSANAAIESPTAASTVSKYTTDGRDKKISLNDESDEEEDDGDGIDEEEKDASKRKEEQSEEILKKKAKLEAQWTQERLAKEWRRFNIDLAPKLLLSRGSMVDLLVSSDIAKYADFRIVSRILTRQGDELKQVPCCRADVFNSKEVSVLEKRLLMKFLNFCVDCNVDAEENDEAFKEPFEQFLTSTQKLTPVLKNYVLNAIAMAPAGASTKQGLKRVQSFLHSLGRYGNTPYLWTLYGSGELPQCFCRMCAVFGGIYILRKTARTVILESTPDVEVASDDESPRNQSRVKGIICTGGMRFSSKWLVAEASYAPGDWIAYRNDNDSSSSSISRGVYMTDASVCPTEDNRDHVTLMSLPSKTSENPHPTSVLELGHTSMVTPKGLFLVHLTKQGSENYEADLKEAEEALFNKQGEDSTVPSTKPNVLWSLRFNHVDTSDVVIRPQTAPTNFLVTPGPGAVLDYDAAVAKARELFQLIAPDRSAEEFLPPAPNPEDIYVEEVEPSAAAPGQEEIPTAESTGSDMDVPIEPPNRGAESAGQNEVQMETDDDIAPTAEGNIPPLETHSND